MIHLDIETKSSVSLADCGVYRYVEDPDFEIQLLSYAYNEDDVTLLDLTNPLVVIPESLKKDILDPKVIKVIHNSQFERICFSRYFGLPSGTYIAPEGWICTMTLALYRGFPAKLEYLGDALDLGESEAKIRDGKRLIGLFAVPQVQKARKKKGRKPTKQISMDFGENGSAAAESDVSEESERPVGTKYFNKPSEFPDDWAKYGEYNKQDVVAERAIYHRLVQRGGSYGDVTDSELWCPTLWHEFWLSEQINDRGVRLDIPFVENVVKLEAMYREQGMVKYQEVCDKLAELNGNPKVENLNSLSQLKALIGVEKFDKEAIEEILASKDESEDEQDKLIVKICRFRQIFGRTSVSKYTKMLECVCEDGRARGLFRFGGAGQTLRYAGRLIQLQNLSKNHYKTIESPDGFLLSPEIDELKDRVKKLDVTLLDREDFIGDLSQLVRPCLIPDEGNCFAVADFSAIEARVLAWMANEEWRINAFKNGEDIYCASASQMFGVPVVKHGENGELRAKGKVAELACGYGGGIGALKAFGADKMGLTDEAMQEVIDKWRSSSPNIVSLWGKFEYAVKNVAIGCGHNGKVVLKPGIEGAITFEYIPVPMAGDKGDVCINLFSGRPIFYDRISVLDEDDNEITDVHNRVRGPSHIKFMGVGLSKKMVEKDTYSGRIVENVTQALARDILQHGMDVLTQHGYKIVAHVHDECIIEIPKDEKAKERLDEICVLMTDHDSWYMGLPLVACGYLCNYYMKD